MRTVHNAMMGAAAVAVLGAGAAVSGQMAQPAPRPVADGFQILYGNIEGTIMKTAELATDELLRYRPSPDVRTFGQILGHIADSQHAFCEGALGKNVDPKDTIEKGVTTRDGLVAALRKSFDECRAIYGSMSDADAARLVPFGKAETAVATVLAFNVSHTNEHYGNLVTYMRMNGIVPPSSRTADRR